MTTEVNEPLTDKMIEEVDERPDCPQESCDGKLSEHDGDDEETCETCWTTAGGQYNPPDRRDDHGNDHGQSVAIKRDEERQRYFHSQRVILNGGFEDAYPEELRNVDGEEINLGGSRDYSEYFGAKV